MQRNRPTRRQRQAISCVMENLEIRSLLSGGPIGDEFMVNSYTPGYQVHSAVASDADGDSVVVWETETGTFDGYDIHGQRYDSAGNPVGEEFLVSTWQTHFQMHPSVAMTSDGDFVVAWETYYVGFNGIQIGARRFAADGTPQGDEFQVNTDPSGWAYFGHPDVAMNDDGAFVVTYEQRGRIDDPRATGILERRFDATGAALGADVFVNTYREGIPLAPSIAMDNAGNSVVVWYDKAPGGHLDDVYTQRFDASGAPVGGNFRVNTLITEYQTHPDVAMDVDGDFAVCWDSNDVWGNNDVYVQRYNAAGEAQGGQFLANTFTDSDQKYSTISMSGDGAFIVGWESKPQDGDETGVYAQRFDPAGTKLGDEFRLNASTDGPQGSPSVATDEQGDVMAVWSDPIRESEDDLYDYNLVGRVFNVSDVAPLSVLGADPNLPAATHSVQIEFDDDVYTTFDRSDVQLIGLQGTASVPASAISVSYNADTRIATLSFPGLPNGRLPQGRYRAIVLAAGLRDVIGNRLAADFSQDFRVITGDADGNGIVDFDDYSHIDNGFNNGWTGYSNGDFNYDGIVDFDDYSLIDFAFNTQ